MAGKLNCNCGYEAGFLFGTQPLCSECLMQKFSGLGICRATAGASYFFEGEQVGYIIADETTEQVMEKLCERLPITHKKVKSIQEKTDLHKIYPCGYQYLNLKCAKCGFDEDCERNMYVYKGELYCGATLLSHLEYDERLITKGFVQQIKAGENLCECVDITDAKGLDRVVKALVDCVIKDKEIEGALCNVTLPQIVAIA